MPSCPCRGALGILHAPRRMKARSAPSPRPHPRHPAALPGSGVQPWDSTWGIFQLVPGCLLSLQTGGRPARFGQCRPGSPARQAHCFQSEALCLRPQETLLRAGGGGEVPEQDVPPQPEQHRAVAAGDHRQPPVRGHRWAQDSSGLPDCNSVVCPPHNGGSGLGGLQPPFAQPSLSCLSFVFFPPQAVFHVLDHLCPHPHHLASHRHLRHRPHRLRPTRDDRVSKFESYQLGPSPPRSPVTSLKWQPAAVWCLGVPSTPGRGDPAPVLNPGTCSRPHCSPVPRLERRAGILLPGRIATTSIPLCHAHCWRGSTLGCCLRGSAK